LKVIPPCQLTGLEPIGAEQSVSWVYEGSTLLPFVALGRHRGREELSEPGGFVRLGATGGDTGSTLVMKGSRSVKSQDVV
jgi:hypothetical protein